MEVIHESDPTAVDKTLEIVRNGGVVMLGLSGFFTLICAPTKAGSEKMEEIKQRRKGEKIFSACVGELDNLLQIIEKDSIPSGIQINPHVMEMFPPCQINVKITNDKDFNSIMVRDGALQGFILDNGHPCREYFKALEKGLLGYQDENMTNGKTYSAILGTSANVSGVGTITKWEDATVFCKEKEISLGIHFDHDKTMRLDSITIFRVRSDSFIPIRQGTMFHDIQDRLHVRAVTTITRFTGHIFNTLCDIGGDETIDGFYQVFRLIINNERKDTMNRSNLKRFLNSSKEILHETSTMSSRSFIAWLTNSQDSLGLDSLTNEDIHALFHLLDEDNDQQVSFPEFMHFLEYTHEEISPQLKALKHKFVQIMRHHLNQYTRAIPEPNDEAFTLDDAIKVYQMIDRDGGISLSKEELHSFLWSASNSEKMSEAELDVLYDFMKTKEVVDEITFLEFLQFLDIETSTNGRKRNTIEGDDDEYTRSCFGICCIKCK